MVNLDIYRVLTPLKNLYVYIAQSVNNQSYSGILLSLGCNVF